jgi:hypothetical protein
MVFQSCLVLNLQTNLLVLEEAVGTDVLLMKLTWHRSHPLAKLQEGVRLVFLVNASRAGTAALAMR